MEKNELKFKENDIVVLKNLPNLFKELEKCGIYYPEEILDVKGKIISVYNNNNLHYYVRFDNKEKDCCYLPEHLLELVTTEKNIVNNTDSETIKIKYHKPVTPLETIKIKYHEPISPLENINGANSDWIDLRCAEPNGVDLKTGEFKLISLGVSMKLPEGYEAHVVPRSSTFKNYGIIQTNHEGIIDNSFCGDNDKWMFPAYATRDTHIDFNDRICQFRIMKKQPVIVFKKVDHLDGKSRGGFGSSGIK